MNWDDLNSVWGGQGAKPLSDSELAALSLSFRKQSRKLSGRLFWRDVREISAGLLVVGVFALGALKRGREGWPLWISSALVLGVVVFLVLERLRVRRDTRGPEAPLLEKIDADIEELRHQHRLLMNVGSWYLGPIVLSWAIVMASTGFHGLGGHLKTAFWMGSYSAGALLLFWGVWKLNRAAARKYLEPKIAELETLKKDILSHS